MPGLVPGLYSAGRKKMAVSGTLTSIHRPSVATTAAGLPLASGTTSVVWETSRLEEDASDGSAVDAAELMLELSPPAPSASEVSL